ncbi:MAG: hypothetical protein EOP09_00175 [Proteobacteria bacterium]|nr:MAG: hypothetical protein EOP09_00175 [Pseudomonadota bacterium]
MQNLKGLIQPEVFNLGLAPSRTISNLRDFHYIPYARWNIFGLYALARKIRTSSPDVLHAYDHKSLFVARLLSLLLGIPVIYTKCGGPNGSRAIPFANRIVLFSGENYSHYCEHGDPSRYILIPNRLNRPHSDPEMQERLVNELGLRDQKILLRISRFNRYYDHTFNQTEALFRELRAKEMSWHLVFLGAEQDPVYLQELKDRFGLDGVYYIVEESYTKEASKLIPIADAVVATGRGAMEACYFGKRVFCPTAIGRLPVEINDATFDTLFHFNFSERAPVIQSEIAQETAGTSMKVYFEKFFLLDTARTAYLSLYGQAIEEGSRHLSNLKTLAYHALQFFRPR